MAKEFGLTDPEPIMSTVRQYPFHAYVFRSGPKYYLWHELEVEVFEIEEPRKIEEIMVSIKNYGEMSLKVKDVIRLKSTTRKLG